MKALRLTFIALFTLAIISCGEDEEDKKCLTCEGGDTLCEGDTDPDTGEKVELFHLELAKSLAEGFGADCTLK
ncbi:MAG: hypothetical protein JXQ96_18840 [Cyclobacteriaceae bacterium]